MIKSVGEMTFGKCAIGVTVVVDNEFNCPLEDPVGRRMMKR